MYENPVKIVDLYYSQVNKSLRICRALNNPFRQALLKLLEDQDNLTVTQIYLALKADQSVTSAHLGILRRNNIVIANRDGKCINYCLNHERIMEIYSILQKLV
jgi:DNA-binding transcriptional ArsR family regulator